MKEFDWKDFRDNASHFFLIAGPCVVESRDMTFRVAEKLVEICTRLDIPLIFKSSYRKANRSRIDSFVGIGDDKALKILSDIRIELEVPVVTDIHESRDAAPVAECVDVLQIPAFLSRQTELLHAAALTGKVVNIKKGQFMSPESMKYALEKVSQYGNDKLMLTDRGTMFGYGDLIVDFRSIPRMQKLGVPVVMDSTHSLQQPNMTEGVTGGNPEEICTIASAAIAVGADGIFIETHPDPAHALSDGASMLELSRLESLLERLLRIEEAVHYRE